MNIGTKMLYILGKYDEVMKNMFKSFYNEGYMKIIKKILGRK